MYHTGIDPMTKQPVYSAKGLNNRKLQRALLQFFKPENYFEVRKALEMAGRKDLIGTGCNALIPPYPPAEALNFRRAMSMKKLTSREEHRVPSGYRPGRVSASRQERKGPAPC